MAKTAEKTFSPAPVRVSRTFHAPRRLVFEAWSRAEHVSRWFARTGFTIPEANVEMRVGGPFEVLMRAPNGVQHWARGKFVEISKFDRLVIDFIVEDHSGHRLFRAYTEVDFADALGGTAMSATQTYTVLDPAAAWMAEGAPQGWAQTLDNLAAELERIGTPGQTTRSVVHASFALERAYDAPVERVYRALSDREAKDRWFGSVGPLHMVERSMDFRTGGRERAKARWESGVVSSFDALYHDIVPNERIVYSYEMHLDDRKISVSLATMQLKPAGPGKTVLKVTEQGAFLDGYDDSGAREHGTGLLLDKLGESLVQP
jgi:uncharacterized protein YndB with AHSA1/START domain